MALYVLFVAHGMNVNFHLCTEDHQLTSSFGDASLLCEHCLGHHHQEHGDEQACETNPQPLHYGSKCCCEDYESEIGFTDDYTFSSEKILTTCPVSTPLAEGLQQLTDNGLVFDFHRFVHEKIPYLLTGRLRAIFFSHLKLNPQVF